MARRVVIFVDYQNSYMRAREALFTLQHPHQRGQFNPAKLGQVLVDRGSDERELTQVRMYCGMPSNKHDPKGYGARRRQTAAWVKYQEVHVVTRSLRYRANYPSSPPEEKGIDVQLAVDFISMAMRREFDVGIIMSEDTDLVPALEAVLRLDDPDLSVEVAAWEPSIGHKRGLKVPGFNVQCHFLDTSDYSHVEDRTIYSHDPHQFYPVTHGP